MKGKYLKFENLQYLIPVYTCQLWTNNKNKQSDCFTLHRFLIETHVVNYRFGRTPRLLEIKKQGGSLRVFCIYVYVFMTLTRKQLSC